MALSTSRMNTMLSPSHTDRLVSPTVSPVWLAYCQCLAIRRRNPIDVLVDNDYNTTVHSVIMMPHTTALCGVILGEIWGMETDLTSPQSRFESGHCKAQLDNKIKFIVKF